jgi:hypothetical protein
MDAVEKLRGGTFFDAADELRTSASDTAGTMAVIDAGLRCCGVSVWVNGELVTADYVENSSVARGPAAWKAMATNVSAALAGHQIDTLVIETMQVYESRTSFASDLLEVNGCAGAIVASVPAQSVVGYLPRQWTKRDEKKAERHERLKQELEARGKGELTRIKPPRNKSLFHNTLDSVCIGLHHLSWS